MPLGAVHVPVRTAEHHPRRLGMHDFCAATAHPPNAMGVVVLSAFALASVVVAEDVLSASVADATHLRLYWRRNRLLGVRNIP